MAPYTKRRDPLQTVIKITTGNAMSDLGIFLIPRIQKIRTPCRQLATISSSRQTPPVSPTSDLLDGLRTNV